MEKWIVVDLSEDGVVEEFDSKQEAMDMVKDWVDEGEDVSEVKIYKVVEMYVPETSVEFVKEK